MFGVHGAKVYNIPTYLEITEFGMYMLSCRSICHYSASSIYKQYILNTTAVQQLQKIHDMSQKYTSHPQEKLYPSSLTGVSFSRQFPWDRNFVSQRASNSKGGKRMVSQLSSTRVYMWTCVHECMCGGFDASCVFMNDPNLRPQLVLPVQPR